MWPPRVAPAPVEKRPVLACIEQRPSGHNARYSRKLTLFKVGQPQKIRKLQTHLICHLESVHCSLLEGTVRRVEAQWFAIWMDIYTSFE